MAKATATRLDILQKAFELIYVNGYQATSVDDIIETTKVTKGAFYYHFKNKDEMGLAVINEVMLPSMNAPFVTKLQYSKNPVKDIYDIMKYLLVENDFLKMEYGCPAGNLTQEMSPLSDEFNKALGQLTKQWHISLQQCIAKGKRSGLLRTTVNAEQVTNFIMAGYWGVRTLGKLNNSANCYQLYLKELKNYLKSLQ